MTRFRYDIKNIFILAGFLLRRFFTSKSKNQIVKSVHSLTFRPYVPEGGRGGGAAVLTCQTLLLGNEYACLSLKYSFKNEENKYSKKRKNDLWDLWGGAYFAMQNIAGEKDCVYITHDYGAAFGLYLKKKKYVLVTHLQGARVEEKINYGEKFSKLSRKIIQYCEKKTFQNAEFVCFPSYGAYEYFCNSKYKTVKRFNLGPVLYNTLYAFPVAEPLKNVSKDEKTLTFLSVGQLTVAKGMDRHAEFFAKLLSQIDKNIRYIFVGKGPLLSKIIAELDELKAQYSHFSYIHISKCSYPNMQYLQDISDVYLMLHRISIFDLATLELMNKSKVILLSKVGGNPEFSPKDNIILHDQDMEATAKRFLTVDLLKSGALNKSVYNECFSNACFITKYQELINLLISPIGVAHNTILRKQFEMRSDFDSKLCEMTNRISELENKLAHQMEAHFKNQNTSFATLSESMREHRADQVKSLDGYRELAKDVKTSLGDYNKDFVDVLQRHLDNQTTALASLSSNMREQGAAFSESMRKENVEHAERLHGSYQELSKDVNTSLENHGKELGGISRILHQEDYERFYETWLPISYPKYFQGNNWQWSAQFKAFYHKNKPQINQMLMDLKSGLDDTSVQIVDDVWNKHINLIPSQEFIDKKAFLYNRDVLYTDHAKNEQNVIRRVYHEIIQNYKIGEHQTFEIPVFYYKHGLINFSEQQKLYIKHGDILDIGAYVGDSAIVLAEFTEKTIYSIEPFEKNYLKLLDNIKLNNVEYKVKPFLCSISGSIDAHAKLHGNNARITMTPPNTSPNYSPVQEIESTTIDNFVQDNQITPKFVKMDIEGLEYEAILKAKATIEHHRPIMAISIYHTAKDFLLIKPLIEKWSLDYVFRVEDHNPFDTLYEKLLICIPREVCNYDLISRSAT